MKKILSILILLSSLSCEQVNDGFLKTVDQANVLTSFDAFVNIEKIKAFNSLSWGEKK